VRSGVLGLRHVLVQHYMNCHFGADRMFGFSIQLQIPIIVNKPELVRQTAGCWTPLAVQSQKIADTLQSELYSSNSAMPAYLHRALWRFAPFAYWAN
jgi:hypothetical protein